MFGLFKKRDHSATLLPAGIRLNVKGGEKLLSAALAAGLGWPHDCRVGSCGSCRCVLKEGRVKSLTDLSYTLTPEEIAGGTILACQTLLKSDVTVDIRLSADTGVTPTRTLHGFIRDARRLTHDILEVEVELADGSFADARAGQYVDVQLASLAQPRSYSFARAPTQADRRRRLTFFIRHVPGGEFTDWLFGADRRGTELELVGPYGQFYLRAGAGRVICVAGGSGLAPIHALLEDAAERGVERDCLLFLGARTQVDLYYLDELAALARRWAGVFDIVPALSSEPGESPWDGARGLVTDELTRRLAAGCGPGDQAYLCGPPAMIDAGIAALARIGLPPEAIFFDKFLDASTQVGGRAGLSSARTVT